MAEKTEKATPKKLKDARKKGQVAKAQDFPAALTFIVAIAATLYSSTYLFEKLGGFLTEILTIAPKVDVTQVAPFYLEQMMTIILQASLPIIIVVTVVGMLVGFLVVGPTFSMEVLKPNVKKFNPVENLKQKFKLKTLIELLKSVLKLAGAALLIYLAVKNDLGDIVATAALPITGAAFVFKKILYKVVIWVGVYFIIIAVADLAYQRYNFGKEMKMEKFEVKQEYKDTEGNPEIKGKRRQLAQEIAYDEGTTNIRRAKAVITNPEHIAVAIGYEPDKYAAPWIVAMGTGMVALYIMRDAEKYNIPIMRNVPLAHELLEEGGVNQFVPEKSYEAIGEILLFVASLRVQG